MEITILMLVAITFFAGVVGGLVIADHFDTYENKRERRRRQRREKRQARNKKMRKMPTFTIDKF